MQRDLPLPNMVEPARGTPRDREIAVVLFAIAWILVWYWQTSTSIVSIWNRSETFAHGYVILPIVGFLIWRNRAHLATVPTRPFLPALLPLALVGFVWLFAELANILGLAQFMLAAMIPLVVWTILGTAMLRALAFPLAFMFFAIPFGEFMLPQLIDQTADFTIAALRLTGIPVYREGNNFVIPSGRWSVVEACSGIRYLIASVVVGTLYAYLTYRTLGRRLLFVGISIVVPLVANWLRAYMIVMIGHLSDNKLATGVDHIIYGWIFFGVVMAALFWIASFWRQDGVETVQAAARPVERMDSAPTGSYLRALVLALAVLSVWKPALALLDRQGDVTVGQLPAIIGENGWTAGSSFAGDWKPDFTRPATEQMQAFAKGDARVGVYVAYYRNHAPDSKLVSASNQITRTTNKRWLPGETATREFSLADERIALPVSEISSSFGASHLLATRWYVVGNKVTGSDLTAALHLGLRRLLGKGDDGAIVVVFAAKTEELDATQATLIRFVGDMGGAIDRAVQAVGQQ